jgi:hypothetical protein
VLGHSALGTRLTLVLAACAVGMALLWGWLAGYRLLYHELGGFFHVSAGVRAREGQAHAPHTETGNP